MHYALPIEKRCTKSKVEKPVSFLIADELVEKLSTEGEKDATKTLLQSKQMNVLDVPNKDVPLLPFTEERRQTKNIPLVPFTKFEGRRENLNSILKANLLGWEVKTYDKPF
jgi:hypothetical protein|tara:strand:- start:431 stop:763 length:333 start_codon:yes stop_codon:yes gene_type:complete